MPSGPRPYAVRLSQIFQVVEGTVEAGPGAPAASKADGAVALSDAKLVGDRLPPDMWAHPASSGAPFIRSS